jgi:pimeloyl-ACP methyl ester carboxylesterase
MKNKKALIKKPNKFLKVLKWIGISFAGLLLIGFIYEQVSEFIDKKTLKEPGQMIQVGDHKMHLYCTGENKNSNPTVILEAGGGNIFATWSLIQPELSKQTKVCSYDRSGYGFSEGTQDNRTNEDIAKELETLLANADVPGPYILVGHSIGGYYTRVFAKNNLKNTTALVFIDSSHEEQAVKYGYDPNSMTIIEKAMEQLIYGSIRFGVARVVMTINPKLLGMPKDSLKYNRGLLLSQTFVQKNKIKDDMITSMESANQVASARNFSNVPIRVLTGDHEKIDPETWPEWLAWQKDLATLSSNGSQTVVNGSGHYIHVDEPEVVINTIKEFLK